MKKENYLDRKPKIKNNISWYRDRKGAVTLKIKNAGIYHKLCQKVLKRPEISYIHLDELGSFVWLQLDGICDIYEIGRRAEIRFGEKIFPLYERLIKYFKILESYKFIEWAE